LELPVAGGVDSGSVVKAASSSFSGSNQRDSNQHQFQIIGVLSKLYVFDGNADGLVLVDQHAAHERILLKSARRWKSRGPIAKVALPQTFDLPPRDARLDRAQPIDPAKKWNRD